MFNLICYNLGATALRSAATLRVHFVAASRSLFAHTSCASHTSVRPSAALRIASPAIRFISYQVKHL